MTTAVTRNMAGEHSGRERGTQIGGSESSSHGWLRRLFWMAAATAAILLLSLGAGRQAQAQTFTTIHSFSGPDGEFPGGSLIRDESGNLYGTTIYGGSYDYGYSDAYGGAGYGTVFKIDPSGNETVLYSFSGGADGAYPAARLVRDAVGNLYGTTGGGSAGYGIVFKIDPSGNETILHSFTGGVDGANPYAGLVRDAVGNLYGTTTAGGSAGLGTVFKVRPSGTETILHSFTGGADGAIPYAGLVRDAAGNLYGTASGGGEGYGTVFKIDPSGNETVLYSFTGGADGANPCAGVVRDAAGNLYGTTNGGGLGSGTVFKINTSGIETVLYSFTGVYYEGNPWAGVVRDASGNLYGTLDKSGSHNCFLGCGVVYKIDPSGNHTVLHSFDGTDGARPFASLMIDALGNLYGTAEGDTFGAEVDYGTVFKIDFSVPFSAFRAKLDTTAGPPPGFQLQAFFTQGTGAPAIDPVAQGMTLTVGTYTVTIPPGAFHQTKKGWFVYEGKIGGVVLEVRISQTGASSYELQAEASRVDLTSLTNPIAVTLALGNNNGTIGVNQ